MVPTPKRLDSVEVHNNSASSASVTVVYEDQVSELKADFTETSEIEAGSSKLFSKVLDMGSWTVSCFSRARRKSHLLQFSAKLQFGDSDECPVLLPCPIQYCSATCSKDGDK